MGQDTAIETDILIIGSGLAGLLLAIDLVQSGASIVLACKGNLSQSNSTMAQGGVAAVVGQSCFDSCQAHLADTIAAGHGLTDHAVARSIIGEGASLVLYLAQLGVHFDLESPGNFALAREGGHSFARILHNKDATGQAITGALIEKIHGLQKQNDSKKLLVLENAFARDFLIENDCCTGAVFSAENGDRMTVLAPHAVLATGGAGQIFSRTTNPYVATGDGIAMAYRAGAVLADLEFMQFHPTAFSSAGAPAFLITEAVRGAGAHLVDHEGKRFAFNYHKDGELATRDIVSRAIYSTMAAKNIESVFLDMRPIGSATILEQFPNIVANCRQYGIDPVKEVVPVSPAAHYLMGGILTDLSGRTSISGLYAIGECASTGLHGANRLASNSLLEAGVIAMHLGRILSLSGSKRPSSSNIPTIFEQSSCDLIYVPEDAVQLKKIMYRCAGVVRNEQSLLEAIGECEKQRSISIESVSAKKQLRLSDENISVDQQIAANQLLLSRLIALAALKREESRGAHFREDFPIKNDSRYRKRQTVSKKGWGWMPIDNDVEMISAVNGERIFDRIYASLV